MEHDKLSQSPLLKADRTLSEEGWAKSALWSYSRKEAKASGLREADSYIVIDPERSFIMLIDFTSNGMKASHRIIYVDTQRGEAAEVLSSKVSLSKSSPLPEDPTSDSEISFADHAMTLAAVKRGKKRQLLITAPYLELPDGKSGLKVNTVFSPVLGLSVDVRQMARQISRLSSDGQLRESLRKEGRLRYENVFTLQKMMKDLVDLYNEM